MGWVVKIPKRRDFCGLPPCPLCFDWVEEQPVTVTIQEIQAEPVKIGGFDKFCLDMVGKRPWDIQETVLRQLEDEAEKIHKEKVNAPDPCKEWDKIQVEQLFAFQLRGAAMRRAAEKATVIARRMTLDQMDVQVRIKEMEPTLEQIKARINEIKRNWSSYSISDQDLLRVEYAQLQQTAARLSAIVKV